MSRTGHARRKYARSQSRCQRQSAGATHGDSLLTLLKWFLPDDGIFAKLKFHGNTSWLPLSLVWLGLCWAWAESRNVTDAFTYAVEWCETTSGSSPLSTYQGFMAAMVQWTPAFMAVLWTRLHQLMSEIGGEFWRIDSWVPIAFDGSRSSAPRTVSNEKAFCAANYGNGKTARYRKKKTKGMRRRANQRNKPRPQEPQAWITMMWHMGLRLPWMWQLGPSNSSERAHVMDMIQRWTFPSMTLFCGDAGFVGYPLWSAILARKGDFLVRVGANVKLLAESTSFRSLKGGIVLCWPKAMLETDQPPLRLRLVKIRLGRTHAWMLTSVLDSKRLSTAQIIKFYKLRWGVEVEFRGLKQTLDRALLRCRNDRRLLVELNWSIMAMAVAELFALKEQLSAARITSDKASKSHDPKKRSLAKTIRAIRRSMRQAHKVPRPHETLPNELRGAQTDNYQRKAPKRSRHRRPNPDKKPLGDPQVRKLNLQERRKLNQLTAIGSP
jgi:Transposase DDE domain